MIEKRTVTRKSGTPVPQFRLWCQCSMEPLTGWLEKAGYAHGAEASHHDTPVERGGCWLSADDRRLLRESRALFEARSQHPSRRPR
jgi:hypothetical protein